MLCSGMWIFYSACLVSMYVKLLVFFTLPVAQNNWQYESTEGKAYKNKYDI